MSVKKTTFLGIDIAGHTGATGVAVIERIGNDSLYYHIPDPEHRNWNGNEGLAQIACLAKESKMTAVDQPFAWPEASMKLLFGEGGVNGATTAALYLWRKTDEAMRCCLAGLKLPKKYVLTATRCQNIWRALALAAQLGITREEVCLASKKMIETHPRFAWAVCLQNTVENWRDLIQTYKPPRNDRANEGARESRERMLDLFECHTALAPRDDEDRQRCIEDDNELDALMCAYVAYLFAQGQASPLPRELNEETRAWEGAAILPSCSWIE